MSFVCAIIQAKKEAKLALARKGFKVPDSDQLSKKRVNPAKLEVRSYTMFDTQLRFDSMMLNDFFTVPTGSHKA